MSLRCIKGCIVSDGHYITDGQEGTDVNIQIIAVTTEDRSGAGSRPMI